MKLKESFGIDSYPTLTLFKNGDPFRVYLGERTSKGIIDFLTLMLTKEISILRTENELNNFLKDNKGNSLIGEFKNENFEKIKKLKKIFLSDAVFEEFPIGIYINSTMLKNEEIKLFSSFQNEISIFDSSKNELNFENLKKFVLLKGYPFIDEINFSTFQRLAQLKLPLFIGFLNLTNEKQKNYYMNVLEKIGKKFENKMKVVFANGIESKDQIETFGLNSSKLPKFAGMKIQENMNFPYDEKDFKMESFEKWINSFLDDPIFHSEPEPEINTNDKPVFTIVGITFDKYTLDSGKDIFLQFYISKE